MEVGKSTMYFDLSIHDQIYDNQRQPNIRWPNIERPKTTKYTTIKLKC